MSARSGQGSFEAYLREEAAEAERFTAGARLAIVPLLLVFTFVLAPFSDLVRSTIPLAVAFTLVAGAYAVGVYFLSRRRYHPALSYLTTAVDIAFVTLLTVGISLAIGTVALATKSPSVLVYFALIAIAGLRLSAPLPLYASGVASLAYLALLVPLALTEPGRLVFEFADFESPQVSIARTFTVTILLLATGAIVAVLTSRARRLVRRSLHTLTFLYADLRGFTAFVEARGDAAGAALVSEYRRLVRAEVARAGGRELKTEGDSFLVEFRTARQALECATGILARAAREIAERPELPLRIGIGLHAGEPVRFEQDYIGSAVNVAARLGQAAEAGELLASDVVRGLLRTSGAPPARERDGLALKGITDPPRVYSFDWSDRAASAAAQA